MKLFYFDKKIYYIDYYEGELKISNAGFISLVFKDRECLVHIGIRNLRAVDSIKCKWYGIQEGENIFLEEFRVESGKTDFVHCYPVDAIGKSKVDYASLEGFHFSLGTHHWGNCFIEGIQQKLSKRPAFQAAAYEEIPEQQCEKVCDKEKTQTVKNCHDSCEAETKSVPVRTTWEELIKTHQIVHPFDNQGEYISINPLTLKLFAPKYRRLANNSFLLHGFYNYRHIILGYYRDEDRQGYYIGVPGSFHEKEQMVAEMFGFEGYEHAGKMGYYMRKVEF
ncbi:MAG TPA: hypothetical protein PLQ04_00350 [Lachnospiraceae bacterium]|nr:hypothetical protein [Lachnospiraceae bacterium]